MQIEVKDGKPGYVIGSARDALECLKTIMIFLEWDAQWNSECGAAANGLNRWLGGLIAQEEGRP